MRNAVKFSVNKYIPFQARIFAERLNMKIVVLPAVTGMFPETDAELVFINDISGLKDHTDADAVFNFSDNSGREDYSALNCPVFINSMNDTLQELHASANMIRMNAWPGFFEKDILETAGEMNAAAANALKAIHKKYISVPDEPGFVSPRVIAMIINEAYFAKGEEVSTEEDIDTAMKLGTNYPYGPFEWCRKIGAEKLYSLLKKLSAADQKYNPAPALENEIAARR